MKNLFTFVNSSGERQLRMYVKVALVLFAIIATVGFVNSYNRNKMLAEVMADPRPLGEESVVSVDIPATPSTDVLPTAPACPTDSAEWVLPNDPLLPQSNIKGLEPQCVKEDVEKVAAWLYASGVLGYSRGEAAQLLGFDELPFFYFDERQISVVSDTKSEPQLVNLEFPPETAPSREWKINNEDRPGEEFGFKGCFRTVSFSGGQTVNWGKGFSVICTFQYDRRVTGRVLEVNGYVGSAWDPNHESERGFFWVGYNNAGSWLFLGYSKDWKYPLAGLAPLVNPINETVMLEKYGLSMQPLPADWKQYTTPEHAEAYWNAFVASYNSP